MKRVVPESLSAKFDILVADVRKDCRLRMNFVVFTNLRDNTALNVAEETMKAIDDNVSQLTQRSECQVPYLFRESS